MIRETDQDGVRLKIDATNQVIALDCPQDITWNDPGLAKSVAELHPRGFASASILAAKAKAFDDGLIAAVELATERGAGTFAGKEQLLGNLAASAPLLDGARALGSGATPSDSAAAKLVEAFLADERASKPLGFYTWSPALENIFRQDRFLQQELEEPAFRAVTLAMHANPRLRGEYEAWMALNERLTNPFTRPDLRLPLAALDRGAAPFFSRGVAVAPPSESPEGALVKRLYGNAPIPEGFNLADRLIEEIRKGRADLSPTANSGWYDRIAWSLETLAAPDRGPEAKKLDLSKTYRETLEALFKGILALARESHVKQLEEPCAGCGPPRPKVRPELSVEPVPTHYLRRALGYRFVREVLESAFGSLKDLRRMTADGPVAASLGEELASIEQLFFGAHVASCHEIGLAPDPQAPPGSGTAFGKWVEKLAEDPDLKQDNRMMVPVFYDLARRQTKVWAFLGWTSRPLTAQFKTRPKVEVLATAEKKGWFGFGGRKAEAPGFDFEDASYALIYPVTAEVYVTKRLNREEFRAHCDRYKSSKELVASLK
ncbi:MAG: hypothetical protein FD180_1440 [Planctomycetota bacterium]|nr:MAG: hypothetical protein FD180_1440 [Planctomycetota bacterium]